MIWLLLYEYFCLHGMYYAKTCKLDTQLSEKKTTLNFVYFSCVQRVMSLHVHYHKMRSHFHGVFTCAACWSRSALPLPLHSKTNHPQKRKKYMHRRLWRSNTRNGRSQSHADILYLKFNTLWWAIKVSLFLVLKLSYWGEECLLNNLPARPQKYIARNSLHLVRSACSSLLSFSGSFEG